MKLNPSLLAIALALATPALAQSTELTVAASSHTHNWNAVAPRADNTLFAAAPRWTRSRGPQLVWIDQAGDEHAWPDRQWNSWTLGQPAARHFININAIRRIGDQLWVVDTGAPDFGGKPLPQGAKVVVFNIATGNTDRIYYLGPEIAGEHSYVDDVRIKGRHAYLTDAGWPGLIVLDLESGAARRVLTDSPSTRASDKAIWAGNNVVLTPDGSLLKVNADPLELSPDRQWLYYGPLNGPMYRIPTRALDNPALDDAALAKQVEVWFDMPPTGGTAMGKDGTFYFSDLEQSALKRRLPDGRIETVIQDERLHWVDAPVIDDQNVIWMPVPQMDRVSLFQGGKNRTRWPVEILKLDLQTR
ncbi:hypothetical protein LA374_03950 [Aeromonas schubertii]|uniref:Major royal jelly protein n=1 Tax=Aeromonas schubertii TaxID=652 RepID=A0ABS7V7I2_9GAMM|nr:major royal jelly family protein [Aeromonas schubertii]MBZ6065367.1 hypothetical protein [Aeromonas schubertii]